MNPLQIAQGSAQWHEFRMGKVGSSGLAKVLAFSKRNGESLETREQYKRQKLAEIMTGGLKSGYVSPSMQFGIDNEPLMRAAYEERTGLDTIIVGVQPHPTIERAHASPDAYVEYDGAIEGKCPDSDTHLKYMDGNEVPEEYAAQCWWVLACSGRAWIDFVSFDPRQPDTRYQLFIKRMHRDEQIIATLNEQVEKFWTEVDAMKVRIDALYPPIAVQPAGETWDAETQLTDDDLDAFFSAANVGAEMEAR